MYGKTVRALRNFTRASLNREPEWRTGQPSASAGEEPTAKAVITQAL
jgi:hypothetical protein